MLKYLKSLTLLVIYISGTLTFSQGIAVSPSRIFFDGSPGQTVTQPISFTNNSANEFNFVSSIKDWDRDSVGTKHYYPMGSLEESNSSWLSLSESTLQLQPRESKTVNVSLTIPEDASELSHSMLFFSQVKEQSTSKQTGFGINVLVEVGVQIYHTPSGLDTGNWEFLAFEDMGFVAIEDESFRRVAVKIENTGEINKDATVRFELTSMETGKEIPLKSVPVALLPKAQQWIYLNLPGNLEGPYLAVAMLDAGTQYDLKVAQKEITY